MIQMIPWIVAGVLAVVSVVLAVLLSKRTPKKMIHVTPHDFGGQGSGFKAHLSGDEYCAYGRSIHEAVGDVVSKHPKLFGALIIGDAGMRLESSDK